jgi:hypothetical protein
MQGEIEVHISSQRGELAVATTVKGLDPQAKKFLQEQGCILTNAGGTNTMISYPAGTTRQQLALTEKTRLPGIHYRITFPNGTSLREVQKTGIRYRELYMVKYR